MIKMIAFDLDGTIGETIPMCIKAFEEAVSPYAGHKLSEEEIVQTFGLNELGMIKKVVKDDWKAALDDFYRIYEKNHKECPAPYEGILELIQDLKSSNIPVALITGKGERSCRITLKKFGMLDLFCSIMTGAEDRNNKAESLVHLMRDQGIARNELYYIGDAVSDITASRKAGVQCLSAAWGNTTDINQLMVDNPGHVFSKITDLRRFFMPQLS